jgi:membrane-associated protease RseP (regulator of RpoE activity)
VQAADAPAPRPPARVTVNAVLFVLTVASVMLAGVPQVVTEADRFGWRLLLKGWVFAVPLLSILLAHELGHYVAARIHGVPASLPYFIPMPISPFGTMGAVIVMRGRIASRRALLDIGASGPLAGLAVALPALLWGLAHSEVKKVTGHGLQEGQCLLYSVLKWIAVGPIADGHDVFLHPVAFAGWAGLFVTMINLLPVGQLDGGHIAYALFGSAQNRVAAVLHASLLGLFALNVGLNLVPFYLKAGTLPKDLGHVFENSAFWLIWFLVLSLLKRTHPPTEPGDLGPLRTGVAIACLVLFVLLFMPTPMATY